MGLAYPFPLFLASNLQSGSRASQFTLILEYNQDNSSFLQILQSQDSSSPTFFCEMLRHIVLVYSLACISHVFGKPYQAKNFARDSAATSMWTDAGLPTTSISSTSPTSITTTITVVTTGVAGSITVIEFPTTGAAGDVSIVTSTLTDGGNGTSPTAGGGTTTPGQVPQPTSPGSPLEIKTMTIKPGRKKTEHITVENDSNETIYVEIILSTFSNSPGSSPTTTSNTDLSAGSQPTSIASGSAPWGTGSTNDNRMHKRENRE